jgi:hypothetical protein
VYCNLRTCGRGEALVNLPDWYGRNSIGSKHGCPGRIAGILYDPMAGLFENLKQGFTWKNSQAPSTIPRVHPVCLNSQA